MPPAVVVQVPVAEALPHFPVVSDCVGIAGGIPEARVVWAAFTEIVLVKASIHKPGVVGIVVAALAELGFAAAERLVVDCAVAIDAAIVVLCESLVCDAACGERLGLHAKVPIQRLARLELRVVVGAIRCRAIA